MYLKEHSDEELFFLLREGNHQAYEELYFRYRKPLLLFTLRKVNMADAENLNQDLWVSLWERRDVIHVKGTVLTYLFTAMRNRIIDHMAKSMHAERYLESIKSMEFNNNNESADFVYREKAFRASIEQIASEYCPKSSTILRLRMEGYNNHEIAQKLNLSEKTIRNRHSSILKYLRDKISKFKDLD